MSRRPTRTDVVLLALFAGGVAAIEAWGYGAGGACTMCDLGLAAVESAGEGRSGRLDEVAAQSEPDVTSSSAQTAPKRDLHPLRRP